MRACEMGDVFVSVYAERRFTMASRNVMEDDIFLF
jgi:hypothetical protein